MMLRARGLILLSTLGALGVLGGCLQAQGPLDSTGIFYPRPKAAFDVRWLDHNEVELDASRSLSALGARIVRYEWKFGDGYVIYDVVHITRHIYERPGRYAISLTVHDNYQQTASTKRVVTVVPEGEVPFDVLLKGRQAPWERAHTVALVARNFAELQRIWLEAFGSLNVYKGPPSVDFTQEMVIALAGASPFPDLRVDFLRVQGNTLQVAYTEIRRIYGPGCVLPAHPAVPTRPLLILKTPRVDLPIHYVRREETEYIRC